MGSKGKNRNTVIRILHDVGAAGWFGGSLMGAVALNGASGDIQDPTDRVRVATVGWGRWSPVAAASIGAHLIGGVGLLLANRDRVKQQEGVGANTAVKAALTVAALATTTYSGVLGGRLAGAEEEFTAGSGTVPDLGTPDRIAKIQNELRVIQWITPVLTGTLIALGAQQGEQQKSGQVFAGKVAKAAHNLRG